MYVPSYAADSCRRRGGVRHPGRDLRAALHAALHTALRSAHTTPCAHNVTLKLKEK